MIHSFASAILFINPVPVKKAQRWRPRLWRKKR